MHPDHRKEVYHGYFIEDGPPATILEVNSNEDTEKTLSISVRPGEGSSTRLSPFNQAYIYRYSNPVDHRQTMQLRPRKGPLKDRGESLEEEPKYD